MHFRVRGGTVVDPWSTVPPRPQQRGCGDRRFQHPRNRSLITGWGTFCLVPATVVVTGQRAPLPLPPT